MSYTKEIVRKTVREKRRLLDGQEKNNKSCQIINKLLNLDEYNNSNIIMCYMDFNGEVETREFLKNALSQGKRILVPLVINNKGAERNLIASEVFDLEKDLVKGNFGILEPETNAVRKIEPNLIDMIIVPGVGFDLKRNRVGFGAGYYDRFLDMAGNRCIKIGVAFEFQIFPEICTDFYDIPMDMIITEERII